MSEHVSIHWFKKGLRIHDNPALLHAVATSKILYPIFIWDEKFIGSNETLGTKRIQFLFRCLKDLQKNLKSVGSELYVFNGDTVSILKQKVKEWNITQLTFITDTEVYYRDRDQLVAETLGNIGVEVVCKVGHTLYDIDEIWKANHGKPPLTYRSFLAIAAKLKDPPGTVRTISSDDFKKCTTPIADDHEKQNFWYKKEINGYRLETDVCARMWPGGETAALERFKSKCDFLMNGDDTSDNASRLFPNTTGLSPYLCLGCLSPRLFYHSMNNRTNEPRKHCLTPLSLQGQILWRDFFYTVSAYTPNFTTMKGNPICLQISWDSNDDYLTRWTEGRTGYPWIDAIMRQLQREGWIHHLARHAVACFLTRGDLWLSWEAGQQVFEQHLLDADYSMNAGNWMWLSASAFYHHYNKMFHPVQFGKRLDPSGDFVRKYVKELESFPTKYIYDPWKAPLEIQKQARCIIGKDYPKPIINHYEATVKNLARMKAFRASQANTIKLTSDSFDYST